MNRALLKILNTVTARTQVPCCFNEKIRPATYFLVETTGEDGIATIDGKKYEPSEKMYKVVLDGKGWYDIYVPGSYNESGNPVWTEETAAPKTIIKVGTEDFDIYTIMNVSPIRRKVILKKVAKDTYASLAGANFRIFRADLSEVTDGQPVYAEGDTIPEGKKVGDSKGCYISGTSGVYFVGQLPEGKYYLVETAVPSGAATTNLGKVFTLEIRDGMVRELEATGTTIDSTKLVDSLRTWVASQPVTTTPPEGGA